MAITGLPIALSLLLISSFTSASSLRNNLWIRDGEDSGLVYNARLQRCPRSCSVVGPDSDNWTSYTDLSELGICEDTMLFTTNVFAPVSDPNVQTYIKACSTSDRGPRGMTSGEFKAAYLDDDGLPLPAPRKEVVQASEARRKTAERSWLAEREDGDEAANCGAVPKNVDVEVENAWHGEAASMSQPLRSAVLELARYLEESGSCGRTIVFAASGGLQAIVGAKAGADVNKPSVGAAIRTFNDRVGMSVSYMRQSCAEMKRGRGWGVAANMKGDISAVQAALATWAAGDCLDSASYLGGNNKNKIQMNILTSGIDGDNNSTNSTSFRRSPKQFFADLASRALCRDIQVEKGDGCGSLAKRCGITGANFEKYNSKVKDLCSTLQEKQFVCCSAGDLPDHTPQPNPDGSCFAYTVQDSDKDGCWGIADKHYLKTEDLEKFNKDTWGWGTCANLNKKMKICLSKGTPPMPTEDPDALCGPTMVGSKRPSDWSKIADVNPCPIKACCNVWGQCGISTDFCVKHPVKGGGPGSSEPNKNGCVSNCGTGIKNNGTKPDEYRTVGYFEAWNYERRCLRMDVGSFNSKLYSHMHFAFGEITPDFNVVLNGEVKKQFDKLKKLGSEFKSKKVLSFGGWAFSNDHSTSPIFRQSVSPANRALFADRVVQFLEDNSLDGLDFDWEYPGAYDIPGSEPGHKEDGANYLEFLKAVKAKLPKGKTLSIALPASYWYLRNFPVEKMADVVDYFIFMTYDLHGQWDYGNKYATPGCAAGNCVRSHVNITETMDALGMVTRAGVSTSKILVGVSSYGRSFKMADSKCEGFMCKYTGSNTTSNAEKGECTNTAGYISNAEIEDLAYQADMGGDPVKRWFDDKSRSNIMTWRGNWVGWMDNGEKLIRLFEFQDMNFGGITDWAVDLLTFDLDLDDPDRYDEDYGSSYEPCDKEYSDLAAVSNDADNIPVHCWSFYTLNALTVELDKALESYDTIKEDYDGKFGWYRRYINDMVDPTLRDWLNDRENPKGAGELTGKGNKYFKCKYREHGKDNWSYEGDCPIPDSERSQWATQDIDYTIKDKAKLEEGLLKDLGISMDWLNFGTKDLDITCDQQSGNPNCMSVPDIRSGWPYKKDKIEVPNPKDIMIAAEKNMTSLRKQLDGAIFDAGLGIYDGDDSDAGIALGSPVGQIVQAVASMDNVKEIGEDVEDAHKKALILSIVGLVLMIVPMVGEIGASLAGMARLARFAFIAGELGNGALDMVDIVENPEAAPMVIAGWLFGAAGDAMSSARRFNEAAAVRRGLDGDALKGMGKAYKVIDDKVNKVCKRCA